MDVERTVPLIVNGNGLPLDVSLSEARDIIALDGHIHVALPGVANGTVTLKITPLEGLIDESFSTSHLVGEELLVETEGSCLYQAAMLGNIKGEGLVNLCNNLVCLHVYVGRC